MQSLRNSQGLHAPLRLEMERKMASKVKAYMYSKSCLLLSDGNFV